MKVGRKEEKEGVQKSMAGDGILTSGGREGGREGAEDASGGRKGEKREKVRGVKLGRDRRQEE